MRSVSFLFNGWKKKEKKSPKRPPRPEVVEGEEHGILSTTSLPEISVLNHSCNGRPLRESLPQPHTRVPGLESRSKLSHHRVETPCLYTTNSYRTAGHGAPFNVRHGPPHNEMHGPPNMSAAIPSSTLPPVSSLRRPHRPPRITIHPPVQRSVLGVTPSNPPTGRSPSRVTFALPYDNTTPPSQRPSSPYLPDSLTHQTREIAMTMRTVTRNDSTTFVRGHRSKTDSEQIYTVDELSVLEPHMLRKSRSMLVAKASQSTPSLAANNSNVAGHTTISTRNQDIDTISLFPSPPSLTTRKPKPLILSQTPLSPTNPYPSSPYTDTSSTDSTPVSTPTTSRPPSSHSSGHKSPPASILKYAGRLPTKLPPLQTPPTSPLPTPPVSPDIYHTTRPLRIAKSAIHLKDIFNSEVPTNRSASRSPLSLEIRKGVDLYSPPQKSKMYSFESETAPIIVVSQDPQVQWGYAF